MQHQNKNFFQVFSLSEVFQLDLGTLAENYRKLQAQVHPDKFANATEQEKMQAIHYTSLINEAYETLSSPQRRAAYLLTLQGIDVTQVKQDELSPQLLLEQIEFREELEELPRDDSAIENLNSIRQKIEARADKSQKRFAENYNDEQFLEAKTDYYEMQYFFKLTTEIDAIEEDILGY